jgi:hypothetical protein
VANIVPFACRFTFPGPWAEWSIEATRLHSQWRDRAGLAPDFPVMPFVGTQGNGASYHTSFDERWRVE